jgi:glycosyltransferase involved in cell wall biosynthesis
MKIGYVNINSGNSRDVVTIRGLRENGATVIELTDNTPGWRKFGEIAKKIKESKNHFDLIIVGYTGGILVPWLWLINKRPVVYNALASFYESMIISRRAGTRFSPAGFKYWLIDWLAFRTAKLILVESQHQKDYLRKTFHISPEKIIIHLTGVDDSSFYFDPAIKKLGRFTVLFRGKFLPEAGVDTVLKAAKLLEKENIDFRILGHGLLEKNVRQLVDDLKLKNVELITEYLALEKLREKMLECHLSLGQMADHPRLQNTIPHKAFESLAMKLPYLTGRQPAVLEILRENETCLCCQPGDPMDLANKILNLEKEPERLTNLAAKAFDWYQNNLTAKKMGGKLLNQLTSFS